MRQQDKSTHSITFLVNIFLIVSLFVLEAKDGILSWNKRFGQVSQNGLDILSSSHKLVIKSMKVDLYNICMYGKKV